jgi:hypothetical protein
MSLSSSSAVSGPVYDLPAGYELVTITGETPVWEEIREGSYGWVLRPSSHIYLKRRPQTRMWGDDKTILTKDFMTHGMDDR